MNPRNGTILCAVVFLILILSAAPSFAQFFARFPSGAAFRFNVMAPTEVEAGREFEMIMFAEHVSGTPTGTPLIRITATPSPIIIPIQPAGGEFPMYCDPNWCLFPWMTGLDQESKKMKFMVDASATPGSVFILKVDVSDNGAGWQNEPDIRVRVKCPSGQQWDASANACIATTSTLPPPPSCTAPCTHFDPSTNACVSSCASGQQCENNECLIPCSSDTRRDPQTKLCTICINPDQQWNPSTIRCESNLSIWLILGAVVAMVAIGIVAIFLLTRRKPRPSAAYKPMYPMGPAPAALKPGTPGAMKPVTHVPRVVARREEEKK